MTERTNGGVSGFARMRWVVLVFKRNNISLPEYYVVEIDGKIRSAYEIFIEALKAGMELKQKFPHSHITVHDVHET